MTNIWLKYLVWDNSNQVSPVEIDRGACFFIGSINDLFPEVYIFSLLRLAVPLYHLIADVPDNDIVHIHAHWAVKNLWKFASSSTGLTRSRWIAYDCLNGRAKYTESNENGEFRSF